MGYEEVPDRGLEGLGMGRRMELVDGGDNDAGIGGLGRIAVAANDAEDGGATVLANCRALTRFGLTFFSRLPPPTEKIRRVSSGRKRLLRSQLSKTPAQPSSLVRAVSSGTFSLGE
jgi:hypothetical protein